MTLEPSLSEREADAAAAKKDIHAARDLLRRATTETPGRIESWTKLAVMCRAAGDLNEALEAVTGALKVDPYDFVVRLLKASILDQSGQRDLAGEAYGHALAQRPDIIPPHLTEAVARAETRHAEFTNRALNHLAAATAAAETRAEPEEAKRIARFRTNIVRSTRVYHSEPTHFHYPGLVEREFHSREDFPWLGELEEAVDTVAAEFEAVVGAERAELKPYVQYPEDLPLRQWKDLNNSREWTAIHLIKNGGAVEANARHCPRTMRLLSSLPQPKVPGRSPNAMFSLLAPGAHIPPHTGVANTRLVCHLPLVVPEGCWFRVGAETREWRRGEAWVFDDTIEHEAANESDALRVLLIIDCWHPGLSPLEREAVAAAMAATEPDDAMEGL